MNPTVRVQLSIMMFLEFFIWGVWFVTMGTYLGAIQFDGMAIGSAYSTTSWGAIVAPFFIGMIADRYFNAERVLGILHLLGAGLLYYVSTVTEPGPFFWALLAYTLCYMPTIALVNAISFQQMTDTGAQFPAIRVWGTLGWIVAGLSLTGLEMFGGEGFKGIEATALPMQIGAGVSLLLGVYSFLLPATPPRAAGQKVSFAQVIGTDALKLMSNPSFAIFVVSSLLICIPLAFYYNFTNLFLNESGMTGVAAKMTMGQMSEVVFMVIMPFFFVRLGVKKMILIGMLAWTLRYVLFAFGNADSLIFMYYGGILLHGICYDFFFVTGQIYVDNEAPKEIRASAQGFIALVTYGVGMVIGANISGLVVRAYEVRAEGAAEVTGHDWTMIWIIPAVMAAIVCVLFAALFRDKPNAAAEA